MSMSSEDRTIETQISESYRRIRERMGMEIEQQKIDAQFQKERQVRPSPPKPSFDSFHSPLRILNPNTCLSSSYKTAMIGPFFDTLGRIFCFANDQDCEAISDPFNKKYSKGRTAIAFLKAGASLILGAPFRGIGSGLSYGVNLVTGAFTSLLKRKPSNMIAEITGQHYRIVAPKDAPAEEQNTDSLTVLTLNCGLLRDLFWDVGGRKVEGDKLPFNELRPPRERAIELADKIIELDKKNPNDVICLQEIFDNLAYFGLGKDAQQIMIDRLKTRFPYIVYDVGQRSWPAVGSGLMLLSKTEILEVEYHRYPNLVGLDTTSNKGFLAAKIKKGDKFCTVYNTHTQAGRGGFPTQWFERLINWFTPPKDPGAVRGEQLGLIEQHREAWANNLPKGSRLTHMDTVLTGDTNQPLNDADKVFTRSHHKHPEQADREKGKIKYQGQVDLLKNFHFKLPENFVDTKIHEPIYILEIDGQKITVSVEPRPDPLEDILTKDFLLDPNYKIKVQTVDKNGKINERDLTKKERDKGKITLTRKGEDPTRLRQLEILIDLEKERIFKELEPSLEGNPAKIQVLRQTINEKFEMMTGSILSKSSLKHALSVKQPVPKSSDIAEPKEVDIATSQKAETTKVSMTAPVAPSTVMFSKQKSAVSDHMAMTATFTYKKDKPKQ